MRKLQERQIKIVTFNIKAVIRWKSYLTQRLLNPTQSWHLWFTKTWGNFTQPGIFSNEKCIFSLSLKENLTCLIENSCRILLIIFDVTSHLAPLNPTVLPVLVLNFNVRCSRSIKIRQHAPTIILYSADACLVSAIRLLFHLDFYRVYTRTNANKSKKYSLSLYLSFRGWEEIMLMRDYAVFKRKSVAIPSVVRY